MTSGKKELPRTNVKAVDVLRFLRLLFAEDENFRIIDVLAKREAANMREIRRCTNISHGKIKRCLNSLGKQGVVEFYRVGSGLNAYRLSPKLERFKKFYQQNS